MTNKGLIDKTEEFKLKIMVNTISRWLKGFEDQEQEILKNPLPYIRSIGFELDKCKNLIYDIKEILDDPCIVKITLFDANKPVEMRDPMRSSYEKIKRIEQLVSNHIINDE